MDRLALFTFVWALSKLSQLMTFNNVMLIFPNKILYAVFILIICFAILKSRSLIGLALLCVSQILIASQRYPFVANHILFATLLDISFLLVIIRNYSNRNKIYEGIFQISRFGLIALYLISVLHKSNSGFLNPDTSCASTFIAGLTHLPIAYHTTLKVLAPYATLFIETSIALLLFFNRTIYVGVGLALITHLIWGLHPFIGVTDFSFMLYSLYILLFPRSLLDKIIYYCLKIPRPFLYFFTFLTLSLFIYNYLSMKPWLWNVDKDILFRKSNLPGLVIHYLWYLFAAITLTIYFLALRWHKVFFKEKLSIPKFSTGSFSILFVIFFIGITPYLGLRTSPAFSMFSNIQTLDTKWNHLFLPKSFKIFPWEEDLALVTATTSPILQAIIRLPIHFFDYGPYQTPKQELYLPYKGLLAWISIYDGKTEFIRNNQTEVLHSKNGRIFNQSGLPVEFSTVDKFFSFRPISLTEHPHCLW